MKKQREAVSIAIFDKDRNFLVVKRENKSHDPFGGMWSIPTVIIQDGESHDEAAKRVAKQKLGVSISVGKQIGVGHGNHFTNEPLMLIEYEAEITEGVPSVPQKDQTVIQFDEFKFTNDPSILFPAAQRNSQCTQILLNYLGADWSVE